MFNFTQEDLCDDDVMLLDTYDNVQVWVGSGANEAEQKFAMEFGAEFIASCAAVDGRDPDCPLLRVTAGAEPPRRAPRP